GYGAVPYCWVNPRTDCASVQVKVRASFKKVDEAHVQDYEPLPYPDTIQTKFGFFRQERITYDRNRGGTDNGKVFFADRHDIWQKAHDAQGNLIDVKNRDVKPVVYYLTPNFPPELMDA